MSWFSRIANVFCGASLGNDWHRETSRDVKLLPWLDAVMRDVRYGTRMLCKSPVVTAAAILSLALAIGACTAAYSLIDALILRHNRLGRIRLLWLSPPLTKSAVSSRTE